MPKRQAPKPQKICNWWDLMLSLRPEKLLSTVIVHHSVKLMEDLSLSSVPRRPPRYRKISLSSLSKEKCVWMPSNAVSCDQGVTYAFKLAKYKFYSDNLHLKTIFFRWNIVFTEEKVSLTTSSSWLFPWYELEIVFGLYLMIGLALFFLPAQLKSKKSIFF